MQKLFINGTIDWWYSERFKDTLFFAEAEPMTIYIDSGGGSVTDGMAIAALMRQHAAQYNVEVKAVGLGFVGSIATVPLLAATRTEMDKNGFLMIHNPTVEYLSGDSKTLRQTAATLDTIKNTLAELYTDKIDKNGKLMDGDRQKTKNAVLQYMAAETWFSAQEALDFGLIDAIRACDEEKKEMAAQPQPPQNIQEAQQRMVALCKNTPQIIKNQFNTMSQDTEKIEMEVPKGQKGIWSNFLNAIKGLFVNSAAAETQPETQPETKTAPVAEAEKEQAPPSVAETKPTDVQAAVETVEQTIARLEQEGYEVKKKEQKQAEAENNAVAEIKNSLKQLQQQIVENQAKPIAQNAAPIDVSKLPLHKRLEHNFNKAKK